MALNSRSASGCVRDQVARERDHGARVGEHLVRRLLDLVLHVHRAGADERVDARHLGDLHGVPADPDVLLDGPRQTGDARALDLGRDRLDRLEVVGRGDREPGLDDVHAQLGQLVRDLELLGPVQGSARRLFAVAQCRVEDPDVPGTAHESPTPPKACVVVRWSSGSGCDPGNGRAGRRCLRIPPRGEEEQAAEEGEVAGAYPNVGLPAGLACRTATHGPGSVCHACVQAQATAGSPSGDRRRGSGTIEAIWSGSV